jgi:hypothetical protein
MVRHGWLMLVILTTQEAEMRRIIIRSHPKQFAIHHLENNLHIKGLVE